MSVRKKLSPKAIALIVLSVVAVVAVTLGLCLHFFVFKEKDGYFRYFRNFTSNAPTEAVATLTLSENTFIADYLPEQEIFVTAKNYYYIGGALEVRYGIAAATEEYCEPIYTSIVEVKGDFALVERTPMTEDEDPTSTYWDLIRFRGAENTPYSVMGHTGLLYLDDGAMGFVGDYLYTYGSLTQLSTLSAFSTFYDYKSWNEPLEKFRIRKGYDASASTKYAFVQEDDYLAAYTTDKAYFYNVRDEIHSGYIEHTDKAEYKAFPQIDDLSVYTRELQVYYLGNGWFARNARLYSSSYFHGFNILLSPDGESAEYSHTRTDFFNVKTGATKSFENILFLANVANRYNNAYYYEQEHYLNNMPKIIGSGVHNEYALPFANPANMTQDGYSIVYFYYMPYLEELKADTTTWLGYYGETTYCIMDENLNVVQPKNALMPTAYVDEVGFTTSDPSYTESRSSAYVYDKFMKETVLAPFAPNEASYITYYANGTAAIVSAFVKEEGEKEMYGAITPSGVRITDFSYTEMTYFSGGYALAYQPVGTSGKYVRIDEKGAVTEIQEEVYNVYHGVYTYKTDGKIGVKNFAGQTLLEPGEGTYTVISECMTKNGESVKVYVAVSGNGTTRIYEIK